jgi:hypothetical protein
LEDSASAKGKPQVNCGGPRHTAPRRRQPSRRFLDLSRHQFLEDTTVRRLSNLFFLMALMILGMTLYAVVARMGESIGGVAGTDRDAPVESIQSLEAAPLVHLALRRVPAILRR